MIYVLWNVYQDGPDLLERHVDCVDRLVDARHVFVDGRYPDFPDEWPRVSDDGTLSVANRRGALLTASIPQIAKRNLGLEYIDSVAGDGDWVLQLDADEEITRLWEPDSDEGHIHFVRVSDGLEYVRPHFWRWRRGLRYRGRHYYRYLGDELIADASKAQRGEKCGFGVHHDTVRPDERERAKQKYYRINQDRESLYVERRRP